MIRRPPRSTLFPTRRSSDLCCLLSYSSRGKPPAARRRKPLAPRRAPPPHRSPTRDRKSTRLNSSHSQISYAVFCLKKKKTKKQKHTKRANRSKTHYHTTIQT